MNGYNALYTAWNFDFGKGVPALLFKWFEERDIRFSHGTELVPRDLSY